MRLRADFTLPAGLGEGGELADAIDEELFAAFHEIARRVAQEARANHPYQNRTGTLESRTLPGPVTGRASQGTLTAEVGAYTGYAGYVEYGTSHAQPYPFLHPAAEKIEEESERIIDEALRQALSRMGW